MSLRTPKKRGQAMVEMAVGFIIFIPILLYALFIQDLLRYRLELQESVVSSPWDYTSQDYNSDSPTNFDSVYGKHDGSQGSDIEHWNRMMWCDHHSGMDSFNDQGKDSPDCSDVNHSADQAGAFSHHSGLSAHACWLNDAAEQVSCDPADTTVGANYVDPLINGFHNSQFPKGGMFRCRANTVVQNYMVPQVFLNFNKNADGSDKILLLGGPGGKGHWTSATSADIHSNAQQGKIIENKSLEGNFDDHADTYIFSKEYFAVLADSWAVTPAVARKPGDKAGGPLYDQMKYLFTNNALYPLYAARSIQFLANAASKDVLSFIPPEDPLTPNLSIQPISPMVSIKQEATSESYYSVPWQQPYQDAYNARGPYYMGCANAHSC